MAGRADFAFTLQRFPDALSKTIPLWCAVLNRARVKLLPPSSDNSTASAEDWERDGALWTLPSAIGRSEHSQIESKIEEWSESLCVRSSVSRLLARADPLSTSGLILRLDLLEGPGEAIETDLCLSFIGAQDE